MDEQPGTSGVEDAAEWAKRLRQRDPVRDTVVHSHQQRAARAVAVDHVHVPERPAAVERRRDQTGDQLLQRPPVARRRQRQPVQVQVELKMRIALPAQPAKPVPADALAEARKAPTT